MRKTKRLSFNAFWEGYVTRTLISMPWIKEIAQDAYYRGRKDQREIQRRQNVKENAQNIN